MPEKVFLENKERFAGRPSCDPDAEFNPRGKLIAPRQAE